MSVDESVVVRPIGSDSLPELARLFDTQHSTRHCWCTFFCTTRTQFALGWFGGGNRRRFASMAASSAVPMGVLASLGGEPVGWAACGPRSRYVAATDPRNALTAVMRRAEDEDVWLVPCLFVGAGHRGRGFCSDLLGAAVDLATDCGAVAVEGWPVSGPVARPGEEFVGRESTFAGHGFSVVDRPTDRRVILRRQLTKPV